MKKGFAMLTVIMMLFFIGTMLFVLTGVSNKITFQTNQAYLEAARQNLISSGLVWAKYNKSKNAGNIELDTGGLVLTNAKLNITIENSSQVTIGTFCSKGRDELKSSKKYHISH